MVRRRSRPLDRLVEQGVDVYCVGGSVETEMVEEALGPVRRRSAGPGRAEVVTISELDHGLLIGWRRGLVRRAPDSPPAGSAPARPKCLKAIARRGGAVRGHVVPVRSLSERDLAAWSALADRAAEANPLNEPHVVLAAARHQTNGADLVWR